MQSSKRVVLNAGILYGRMIFTMGISLFSTRLLLNGLGVKDYGIFNLLGGIIAMLSFLNAAMSTSTQRYLSFHQGKNDAGMLRKIFTNSLVLHIILGIVIVLGLEIAGLFLFDGFLKIPFDRLEPAKAVYHFMALTVFFTVIEAPFTGTLNSHENVGWLALVGILEVTLKLCLAIMIYHVTNYDKLIVYGFLNPCIIMCSTILYAGFCLIKYEEASLKNWKLVERKLISQLASFAGWNLFGSLCVICKNQGIAVMLNIFFGTVINAAYGIANQVSSQLNFLSVTLLQVLNPQIMKSQGAGDTQRMLRLSMIASKFSFFLMAMVSIPCIFEMTQILTMWLKKAPPNSIIFCDLLLISVLINQLTIGLQSSIQSTGIIKGYQIVVGSIILLNIPIAYFILKAGMQPYMAISSFAFVEIVACIFRLYFAKKMTGLVIKEYINKVILREVFPVMIVVAFCFFSTHYLNFKFRFLFTISASALLFSISMYFWGFYSDEKNIVDNMLKGLYEKLFKKQQQQILQ